MRRACVLAVSVNDRGTGVGGASYVTYKVLLVSTNSSLSNTGAIRTNACSVLVAGCIKRWVEVVTFVPTLVHPLSAPGSKLSRIQLKPPGAL